MDVRGTCWRIGVAGIFAVAASCGSAQDESRAPTTSEPTTSEPSTSEPSTSEPSTSESNYCDDLGELTRLLDDGGTVDEYNELMKRIVAGSPADHAPTWSLMLVLSEEPFSYDNFNPALDSLDRLAPDLEVVCADLPPMIVDDSGRVRSMPTE